MLLSTQSSTGSFSCRCTSLFVRIIYHAVQKYRTSSPLSNEIGKPYAPMWYEVPNHNIYVASMTTTHPTHCDKVLHPHLDGVLTDPRKCLSYLYLTTNDEFAEYRTKLMNFGCCRSEQAPFHIPLASKGRTTKFAQYTNFLFRKFSQR